MGRRRTPNSPTSDALPDMVRHKNAVNMELTLAAQSEDVWAAVESGRERRLRLACERSYGLDGAMPLAIAPVVLPAEMPMAAVVESVAVTDDVSVKETKQKENEQLIKAAGTPPVKQSKKSRSNKENESAEIERVTKVKAPLHERTPQETRVPESTPFPVGQPVKATEAATPTPTKESKKSKKNKQRIHFQSDGDDTVTALQTPSQETSLATSLSQIVSEEKSLSNSPSAPTVSTSSPMEPIPISCLSYAEKVKLPPSSPPEPKEPSPPPRQESPEPQYDPTPRASTPPPALPLSPTGSFEAEDWQPVETRREKRARRRSERVSESEKKSETSLDAFDILLCDGEGLHDGLQEMLIQEEPASGDVLSMPIQTDIGNDDTAKFEVQKDEKAMPEMDAFDLLMSGADDFGEGFQEAFGENENGSPAHTLKDDSPQQGAPAIDAFDLLMAAGDDLQAGFEEAFTEDNEVEPMVKAQPKHKHSGSAAGIKQKPMQLDNKSSEPKSEDKETAKVEANVLSGPLPKQQSPPIAENQEPKTHKASKGRKPRSRKNSEKTKESRQPRTPRQSTCSEGDSTQLAYSDSVSWFDKAEHDAAEAQFYQNQASTAASSPPPDIKEELKKTSMKPAGKPLSPSGDECHVDDRCCPEASGSVDANVSRAVPVASQPPLLSTQLPLSGAVPQLTSCLQPQSLSAQQHSLSSQPPSMSSQPPSMSSQAPSMNSQPPSMNSQPPSMNSQPPPMNSQPPSMNSQPPSMNSQPPSFSTQPQSLSSQPQSLSTQPQSLSLSSMPHSLTSQPMSMSSQPQSLASQPLSLASQPDLYFEDVVLPGRQSSVTMTTLPGYTAQQVSERLAPGEELESLRTEPELEPEEPSEHPKPGKNKRTKRRRRRSERLSESERRSGQRTSDSDSCHVASPSKNTTGAKQAVTAEAQSLHEQPPVDVATSKKNTNAKTSFVENGATVDGKSPSKPSRPRQRRKKTKSSSSTGEPADSETPAKEQSPPKAKTADGQAENRMVTESLGSIPAPKTSRSENQNTSWHQTNEIARNVLPAPQSSMPAEATKNHSTASTCTNSETPAKSLKPSVSSSDPSSPENGPSFRPDDEGKRYASLMQQSADMLPARPVFLAHACFVCKRLHSKQCRLKSCGSCRLVAYCSAEHQRAHWSLHRSLCKVVTKRMRKQGTDHIYREAYNVTDHEQWKHIRFKNMTVCEEMLGRPMEPYEKEMFLYPRVCDTCHETTPEKLHTCHSCHSVSYCCEAHLRKTHAKFCKDLKLLVDIHCYQNEHGVCDPDLPDKMLTEYMELPSTIREFLVVDMLGPQKAYNMGNVELAVMSENASYPLTALFALQNIPVAEEAHISQLSELTIHVVGAEFSAECDTIAKWDVFLLNVLPNLRRLHVVFIGPELDMGPEGRPGVSDEDFTCEPCLRSGKHFTAEFQPTTYYHTYCRSPQFRAPNVICAFNAGIYRTTGHERTDSWRETIPCLVRDGVPLIVTAYTMLECPQDVARIQEEQKVDVLLPPMKNPYRSTRPAQNFLNEHENPLIYKNQYVACLTAARVRK